VTAGEGEDGVDTLGPERPHETLCAGGHQPGMKARLAPDGNLSRSDDPSESGPEGG
jgi:hypothetical protein